MTLNYILVSEGSDDQMLHQPIEWLLALHCKVPFAGVWANPSALSDRSRRLDIRLAQVMQYFPCDLAFVHRDTDTETYQDRVNEILAGAAAAGYATPLVCAIPVRMSEAWFLFNESAIRRAAGNPASRVALNLPNHAAIQRRADPKVFMEEVLIRASELRGRKLKNFTNQLGDKKSLVASYIADYSHLRAHSSFAQMEADLLSILAANNW